MKEFKCEDLPIMYNINIGHAYPIGIIPLGINVKVDYINKRISLINLFKYYIRKNTFIYISLL